MKASVKLAFIFIVALGFKSQAQNDTLNKLQKWQSRGFVVKTTSMAATRETVVLTPIILQKN